MADALDLIPPIYQAPFIVVCILGILGTFIFGNMKLIGDKEFYYWWTRQAFIYDIFTTGVGTVKKLLIRESEIDQNDKTFNYLGGTYQLMPTVQAEELRPYQADDGTTKAKLETVTRITEFHHRGRSLYYHSQGCSVPHAVVVGGSLHATVKAEAIYACKDQNIRRQIEAVKPGEKVSKTGLLTILMLGLVIMALLYLGVSISNNSNALQQLYSLFQHGVTNGNGNPTPPTTPTGGI